MVAALAEVGLAAEIAGDRVLMDAASVPPHVALRAWRIAHNARGMTMAEYIAHLKAEHPLHSGGYDRWLEMHGVTLNEVDA